MEKQKNKDAIIISVGGSKLNPRMICYSPLERKLTQGLLIRESWVHQLPPSNPGCPFRLEGSPAAHQDQLGLLIPYGACGNCARVTSVVWSRDTEVAINGFIGNP